MRTSRRALCVVSVLIALWATTPSAAQDLLVARAESLNEVFDDVEAIAHAVGKDLTREMLLMMGSSMLGSDATAIIDLERPVAAVMPVEGMMLMQNGVVVAVPVSDAAAAIDALATLLPDHAVEGELHTLSDGQGTVFYLTAADGYLKICGNADLLTRVDPLSAAATGSTTSVELFLEPIAPMIAANLTMVKAQMMTALEEEAAGEEVPYDPAAMGPMIDAYVDGFRWLLDNTSSIRLRLDVDDGFVRFAEDLVPKPNSDLAGFIDAQKGGLPEIAKLANENSAWYMAGQVSLTQEHRQGLKNFVAGYLDMIREMSVGQTGTDDPGGADSTSNEEMAEAIEFWNEYMAMLSPYADRWIDCLQGDMVASFGFPEGGSFEFSEAFSLVGDHGCAELVSEMSDTLVEQMESAEELSEVFTVARGPKVGGSKSLLMTFDMMKMLDEMGQPSDEQTEAMMQAMYGEDLSIAMVTAGNTLLATGGSHAVDDLGKLAASLPKPGKAPSFSPLESRPGLMVAVNIGQMLLWMKDAVPDGAAELEQAAGRFSGDVGRLPMAIAFDAKIATFDVAMSVKTIEVIAAIVEEERARKAEEQIMASDGE